MMPSHAGPGYPGPGGMGKMHSSGGMMHMSGPGSGSGLPGNAGMYGGPMYGNQAAAGVYCITFSGDVLKIKFDWKNAEISWWCWNRLVYQQSGLISIIKMHVMVTVAFPEHVISCCLSNTCRVSSVWSSSWTSSSLCAVSLRSTKKLLVYDTHHALLENH
jgi:hypothetical protein